MADVEEYDWGFDGFSDKTTLEKQWEVRVSFNGRVYFLNHDSKTTTWEHPVLKRRYRVPEDLPYGWQRYQDKNGILAFVDHLSNECSYIDPRLTYPARQVFKDKQQVHTCSIMQHRFNKRSTAVDVASTLDLIGKVAIITGGSSGLGFETAKALSQAGAHVILACKNAVKGEAAVQKIKSFNSLANVEAMPLDLGTLQSVKQFAVTFRSRHLPLHFLIMNAAVFCLPYGTTIDGIEQHFAVNHLGHFYLFKLLQDVCISSSARVLVVSSEAHWYPDVDSYKLDLSTIASPPKDQFIPTLAYGASKLCNILFALEVHRRFLKDRVFSNAVHPGNLIPTGLAQRANCWYKLMYLLAWPLVQTVDQAAAGLVYPACHPAVSSVSGLYFNRFEPSIPSPEARCLKTASDLWEFSERLIAEKMGDYATLSDQSEQQGACLLSEFTDSNII